MSSKKKTRSKKATSPSSSDNTPDEESNNEQNTYISDSEANNDSSAEESIKSDNDSSVEEQSDSTERKSKSKKKTGSRSKREEEKKEKSREKVKKRKLTDDEIKYILGKFDYFYAVTSEDGMALKHEFEKQVEERLREFTVDVIGSGIDAAKILSEAEKLGDDIFAKLIDRKRLQALKEPVALTDEQITEIVSIFDSFYEEGKTHNPNKLLLPRPQVPYAVTEVTANDQVAFLRSILKDIRIEKGSEEDFIPVLKVYLYERYMYAKVPEGLQVGALAGLYMSERVTQETLSTHKAPGMALSRVAVDGFEMANNLYSGRNPCEPQCYVHFLDPLNWETMEYKRHELVEVMLSDIVTSKEPEIFRAEDKEEIEGWEGIKWHEDFDKLYQSERQRKIKRPDTILRLRIDRNKAYIEKLTLQQIGHKLEQLSDQIRCLNTPFKHGIIDIYIDYGRSSEGTEVQRARRIFENLMRVGHLAGIPNIKNAYPAFTPYRRFILDKSWSDVKKDDKSKEKRKKKEVKIYLNEVLMLTEGCTPKLMRGYVKYRISTLNVDDTVKVELYTEKDPADPDERINVISVTGLDQDVVKKAVEYNALESFESLSDITEEDNDIIISPSPNISTFDLNKGQFFIVAVRTLCYMPNGDRIPYTVELSSLKISPENDEQRDHVLTKLYGKNTSGKINKPKKGKGKKKNEEQGEEEGGEQKLITGKGYLDLSTYLKYYNVWFFETTGSNLKAILALPGVNQVSTVSNVPKEIIEIYGIDAANAMLFEHLNQVVNAAKGIDTAHLKLIVDRMTAGGTILSVDRIGVNKQDGGPLTEIATEVASKRIIGATLHGRADSTISTIAATLAGRVLDIGAEMQNANIEAVMLPKEEKRGTGAKGGGRYQANSKSRGKGAMTGAGIYKAPRRGKTREEESESGEEQDVPSTKDMDDILRRTRAGRKKRE